MPINGHSYSSTQFNLPKTLADAVKKAASKIPDFALHGDGRESEPHVTVKYGLHTNDPSPVRSIVSKHGPFKVRLGKTSHFPDSGHGDVIKAEVHSPDLHSLNHKLSSNLEHTDSHPDYRPHVTIAYVKPGMGKTIAEKDNHSLAGKEAVVDHVIFSNKDDKQTRIPLHSQGSLGKRLSK